MIFRNEYWFLSNMFPCKVEWEHLTFQCAESAYQAAKSHAHRKSFTHLNGFEAKKKGKTVTLRSDWNSIKVPIMKEILLSKFSDPTLLDLLKGTGDIELVEDNTWNDKFWGKCRGEGQNILGKLLMEIRDGSQD